MTTARNPVHLRSQCVDETRGPVEILRGLRAPQHAFSASALFLMLFQEEAAQGGETIGIEEIHSVRRSSFHKAGFSGVAQKRTSLPCRCAFAVKSRSRVF